LKNNSSEFKISPFRGIATGYSALYFYTLKITFSIQHYG